MVITLTLTILGDVPLNNLQNTSFSLSLMLGPTAVLFFPHLRECLKVWNLTSSKYHLSVRNIIRPLYTHRTCSLVFYVDKISHFHQDVRTSSVGIVRCQIIHLLHFVLSSAHFHRYRILFGEGWRHHLGAPAANWVSTWCNSKMWFFGT